MLADAIILRPFAPCTQRAVTPQLTAVTIPSHGEALFRDVNVK